MAQLNCTLHIDDEVNCHFGGLHQEHLEVLWDKFGKFVDGYRFMPSFQLRRWDGKLRFFERTGKTYTKILDEIIPYICTWGYEVDIVDKRTSNLVIKDRIDEMFFNLDSFKLRPYQVNVVNALLDDGSGFGICATGSGKCLSGDTLLELSVPDKLKQLIPELEAEDPLHGMVTVKLSVLFESISKLENHKFKFRALYRQTTKLSVDTPNGVQAISGLIKKISTTMVVKLADGRTINCATTHKFIGALGEELSATDLSIGDQITTRDGLVEVVDLKTDKIKVVYDVEIAHPSHVYYTADGVLHHNTSMCAALSMVLHQNGLQVLIIVPSADLVTQTVVEFRRTLENFNVTIGEYSGSQKDIDHPIVVVTWQSLQNVPHYMSLFQAVLVDECVHPNTLIETIDGLIKIKNLKIGDLVFTKNESTFERELKPIKRVHKNLLLSSREKRLKIKLDNGKSLIITGNHKVMTTRSWKRADELTKNDELAESKIKIISVEEISYDGEVYNLHVEDNHNYYANGVIVANCHGVRADVVKGLINDHGKHISHRYGFTGTFPKPEVDQYSLKLSIGRIVSEVPASWLIENGYLSEILIEPVETVDYDPDLPDYASERAYLTKHEERNAALSSFIQAQQKIYGNTMVLVNTQSLQQGREINDLIPNSVYLDGNSKSQLRQEEYARYAERDDVIVIASAGIASTGISIDRIFCLILLDTGKSFVKCIQAVGRGLRKKGDKNKIHVIDISSKLKYAKKHARDRKKFYTEAQYPMTDVKKIKY